MAVKTVLNAESKGKNWWERKRVCERVCVRERKRDQRRGNEGDKKFAGKRGHGVIVILLESYAFYGFEICLPWRCEL
jgi:hypothetical protein